MLAQKSFLLEGLTLRPVNSNDASSFFKLIEANRERFGESFPVTTKECSTLEGAVIYVEKRMLDADEKNTFCYVIEEHSTGHLIGCVFLKEIVWNIPKAEFAYFIDRNHSGKGIVSRCVGAITEQAFKDWKFNKLYMRISPENLASIRVAEKNGFRYEGLLQNDFRSGERLHDVAYYGLIPPRN